VPYTLHLKGCYQQHILCSRTSTPIPRKRTQVVFPTEREGTLKAYRAVLIASAGILCAGLASAACKLHFEASDKPVTLENELVKIVVDPARGGTVSSFVFKPAAADLTATWRDQPVGQGFGLFIDRVITPPRKKVRNYETSPYVAEAVADKPEEAAVRVTGRSPTGVGKIIQFSKTYRLKQGSAELVVDYSVSNLGRSPVIASIWTTNVVRAGSAAEPLLYFYPTPRGTRVERYARPSKAVNVFLDDAPAAWCGAMGEGNHLGLAASMDYSTLKMLYSYLPGKTADQDFPTLEWWTRNILLKPVKPLEGEAWAGKPWQTRVSIMPLAGLPRLDGYARGLAAAIEIKEGQIAVSLLSACRRKVSLGVLLGPASGPPARKRSDALELAAGQPVTRSFGPADEKTGIVARVEVREGSELLLACERPFGPPEALAGYVHKPRREKLPEARVDASSRLTRAFVTPHVKWATPSKRGKVKTLFMVRSTMQREIVELAQRMDLDFSVVPTQYSHWHASSSNAGLMFYYPGLDPIAEFHSRLAGGKWDAVCIASRYWTLIPEKTRKLLMDRVRGGMALINVNPRHLTPDVRAVFQGPKSAAGSAVIRANVPFAALPVLDVDPTGERWVTAIELGKGRIVLLNYETTRPSDRRSDMTSLTPAIQSGALPEWPAHEYYYSLLARTFLWAAGRLPEKPMRFDLGPAGDIAVGRGGSVQVRAADLRGGTLRFAAHMRSGDPVAEGTLQLQGDGTASIPLPKMTRAGALFLDVWLLDGDKVVDWGTAALRVASPLRSVILRLPDAAYVPGTEWKAEVETESEAAILGATLRLTATDAHERLVLRKEMNVDIAPGSNRWEMPLRLAAPLTVRHKVRASILTDAGEIGRADALLYARTRRQADFDFLVWGAGWVSHISFPARRQIRKIGVNIYETGAPAVRRAVSNDYIRSRCDEILRDDMAIALQSINWMGGYPDRKSPLVRLYCLDDPTYMKGVREGIQRTLRGLDKMNVIVCSTGDEISIGNYASFNDYCQSRFTVQAFRKWLADRYGTIANLNAEWDTDYGSFAEVPGIRFADVEKKPNKAPWAEFRTFMETRMTNYLDTFAGEIHKVVPGARTGFDGNSTLCSYNGFDWWRISGVCDMITLYRTAAAEYYLGSFFRARGVKPHFSMWLSASAGEELSYRPWEMLFKGMTSVDYWYEPLLLNPDLTINEFATRLGEQVTEIRKGIGTLILSAKRRHDPVAILYSQAGVHAATIEGMNGRPGPAELNRDHFAWAHLTEDAGLTAEFISYEQLARGYLQEAGYRVLILPLCYALSDEEAAQIRKFVEAGGLLICDARPGLYNEHVRRVRPARLDAFLGIESTGARLPSASSVEINVREPFELPWGPVDRDLQVTDATALGRARVAAGTKPIEFGGMLIKSRDTDTAVVPAVITATRGNGLVYCLNLPVWRYEEIRGTDRSRQLVALLLEMFGRVGVKPPLPVKVAGRPAPELSTARFAWGDGLYVGLLKALNSRSGEQDGTLAWHKAGFVYDVRAGRLLGRQAETTVTLSEKRPLLLAWLPYEVAGLTAAGPSEAQPLVPAKIRFTVAASSGKPTHHVLRCTVSDPSGAVRQCYSRNVVAENGSGVYELTLALNDPPGQWTVRAEDVVSGKSCEVKITKR